MIQPQIVILKDGTDDSQGTPQLISNINACYAVADILRTTLGPMGMDKLIKTGQNATISNDGATIIELLDIVHPAAKTLVEISQSQDKEIGDGTTSVVLLAAELLKNAKEFIEYGVSPQIIISSYQRALKEALAVLPKLAINVNDLSQELITNSKDDSKDGYQKRFVLEQCAKTALTSKLIEGDKEFFANLIVTAFSKADSDCIDDRDFFGLKHVSGGSVKDSFLINGVAFKKTFSYAGFEQQPKKIEQPKIALLNVELELKTEHLSGEVRVNPSQYKSIVDAEWKILYDKLDILAKAGANIVLSKLPIGDLATQYFAEKNIFCAGRVPESDLKRMARLTGGQIETSLGGFDAASLSGCELFEECQIGKERFNLFHGGSQVRNVATLILRGGAEQYIEEASRSLNDAIMVVKRTAKFNSVVVGGGAVEMELSKAVKDFARGVSNKSSFILEAFAKALEIIPKCLAINAGVDSTDILNELRNKHYNGEKSHGIDIENECVSDCLEKFVWEPLDSKRNILQSATEAACMILSVDETIKVPSSQQGMPQGMPMGGMPQGMPMGGMPQGMMG